MIAHRGASRSAPEHTVRAFDLALEQGADALELDVRATADGCLVVVHDATLLRTAGDGRRVDALTTTRLAAIPEPHRPLALDAVFDRYGHRTRYLVDLKDPHRRWTGRLARMIAERDLAERAVVQSFDVVAVAHLARTASWLRCAPIHLRPPRSRTALEQQAAWATGIAVWHRALDHSAVALAHSCGLTVSAWTVNRAKTMHRMVALGVDALITDVPRVAVDVAPRPSADKAFVDATAG